MYFLDDEILLGHHGSYWLSPGRSVIDYEGAEIRERERQEYLDITKLTLNWIYGK